MTQDHIEDLGECIKRIDETNREIKEIVRAIGDPKKYLFVRLDPAVATKIAKAMYDAGLNKETKVVSVYEELVTFITTKHVKKKVGEFEKSVFEGREDE